MNKVFFLLISLTAFSMAHAGPFNLIEKDIGWSKKNVRVCFANKSHFYKSRLVGKVMTPDLLGAFTANQKAVIKKIVTQEYTEERTGIFFTGWKDCKVDPESDVYIFRMIDPNTTTAGVATMGESGEIGFMEQTDSPGKYLRFFQKSEEKNAKPHVTLNTSITDVVNPDGASPTEHLQLAAVHEFGHISGLQHERIDLAPDKQRYPDLNCDTTRLVDEKEVPYFSTKKVSVYDTNSVMDYCFIQIITEYSPNFVVKPEDLAAFDLADSSLVTSSKDPDGILFNVKIGLSLGDLHALSCLYRYDEETQRKICVPTYNPRDPQN